MANYARPFRLLPVGSNNPLATPNHLSGCEAVPRWQNVTTVRRVVSGSTVATSPFQRDAGGWSGTICPSSILGECGNWIHNGIDGSVGLSEQAIQDTVDDIVACASPDATHKTTDHNCYLKSGAKDFRKCRKVGWKGLAARKWWHGRFGLNDTELCASPDPNQTPATSKWRTLTVTIDGSCGMTVDITRHLVSTGAFFDSNTYVGNGSETLNYSMTVDRLKGKRGLTWTYANADDAHPAYGYVRTEVSGSGTIVTDSTNTQHQLAAGVFIDAAVPHFKGILENLAASCGTVNLFNSDGFTVSGDDAAIIASMTGVGLFSNNTPTVVHHSNTKFEFRMDYTPITPYTINDGTLNTTFSATGSSYFRLVLELSDEYTAAELLADFAAARDDWDLTSDSLYPWRTDEQLANVPLAIYSEVATAVEPTILGLATSTDYNTPANDIVGRSPWTYDPNQYYPINTVIPHVYPPAYWTAGTPGAGDYVPTFAKTTWYDPNDTVWKYPSSASETSGGFVQPPLDNRWPGAKLITGLHTGSIISHGTTGQDSHFWPGYGQWKKVGGVWELHYNGGWSDQRDDNSRAALPDAALRWQTTVESNYDGTAPPRLLANLPQSWIREINGGMIGGKYVETKLPWPSVNFGRPYGKDMFAVDQTTVCATDGTHIRRTGNAIDPLATGGLQNGDLVMVGGDAIYQISAITAAGTSSDWSGRNQFTYTLGAKYCDIPAGCDIGADYIGKMRFIALPSDTSLIPFGLMPCTAVYSGGTTTFTFPDTPYWISVSGGAVTCNVDLYLPDATNGNPAYSVLANVTITKASGTMATVSGDYSTAKWLIPHLHYNTFYQFKPEYDDALPKGDFVRMEWSFNTQAMQGGFTGTVPTWYGSEAGVTGISMSQQRIKFVPCCPSVVGYGTVETFHNQNLGALPSSITASDLYGGYWQSAVETTMTDPFWQAPFKPDLDGDLDWAEDINDDDTGQYPHRPLVEARCAYPTDLGWEQADTPPTLPSGVTLAFDLSHHDILPSYWQDGISLSTSPSSYFLDLERPFKHWLFLNP